MPRGARAWLTSSIFVLTLFATRVGHAYPWMIRHGYTQCQACHLDPLGSGPLTAYGRALGENLLPMRYGAPSTEDSETSGFLWGTAPLPPELLLGGNARVMRLSQKTEHVELKNRLIYMQLDAEAALSFEHFAASASLGYAPEGAQDAALTRGTGDNLVSRTHWIGFVPLPFTLMIRAGRMNLPFGIRNIEHTLWTRAYTRTSTDDDQQYGLSVSFGTPLLRGELMAIAGNFQLRPDEFRERGYSLFLEWTPNERLALGASSLVTHRELDPRLLAETIRHAHGLSVRFRTPHQPLVVLSEWNYVFESTRGRDWRKGIVGHAQADFEPFQGIHFIGTFEANDVSTAEGAAFSYGLWASGAWFFAPQADLRLDNIYQSVATPAGRTSGLAWLVQAHLYL
jgi:hypothetical protein